MPDRSDEHETCGGTEAASAWRPGERARILPRLLALDPADLAPDGASRRRLIARLDAALADEIRREATGHWSAAAARRLGLGEALAAERRDTVRRRRSGPCGESRSP